MKQRIIAFFGIAVMCAALLSGCRTQSTAPTSTTTPGTTVQAMETEKGGLLYEKENDYNPIKYYFQKHFWVDYGAVVKNVAYYSSTAGEEKHCNILFPANYRQDKKYPVLYVLHGFYGEPSDHIDYYSYLTVLYGNLLYRKMAKEMIIVSVDMYTYKVSQKNRQTQEQMHYIYDKVIQDIHQDVMPFIESHYPVKTGKANTAVAGVSEGGAKALCIGFTWMEQFGYVGAFAPNPGVIPTIYYKDSFWENTYFQSFPLSKNKAPFYYLYLAVGSQDNTNIGVTLAYRDALNAEGIPNQTDYVVGKRHDMRFWKLCFYNFLQKVFR